MGENGNNISVCVFETVGLEQKEMVENGILCVCMCVHVCVYRWVYFHYFRDKTVPTS